MDELQLDRREASQGSLALVADNEAGCGAELRCGPTFGLDLLGPDGCTSLRRAPHGPAYGRETKALMSYAAPGVTWISSRLEYWPTRSGGEPQGLLEPEPLRGVACLLFGVGAGGARWLDRLAGSRWFAGLEPRAEDRTGGTPRGNWAMPARNGGRIGTEAEVFFASAALPTAWYAAVSIPWEAGPAELSAALGLVSALRERRDPLGRRLTVAVTVDVLRQPLADAFVRLLLDQGAFVMRAGMGAAGDQLHHLPLRAATTPRRGRLVCVDLADYLHTWRPGQLADLHVIPSDFDQAAQALRRIPVPAGGVRALNLGFHLDPDAPGNSLVEIDRLATYCRDLLLGPDGDMVFTNTDQLDGQIGSADLLVVHELAVAPATATIHASAFHRSY